MNTAVVIPIVLKATRTAIVVPRSVQMQANNRLSVETKILFNVRVDAFHFSRRTESKDTTVLRRQFQGTETSVASFATFGKFSEEAPTSFITASPSTFGSVTCDLDSVEGDTSSLEGDSTALEGYSGSVGKSGVGSTPLAGDTVLERWDSGAEEPNKVCSGKDGVEFAVMACDS